MFSQRDMSVFHGLLSKIQSDEVKFIDIRFVSKDGIMRTYTYSANYLTDEHNINGIRVFTSGHQEELLLPDVATAFIDPFSVEKTLVILCTAINGLTDPRVTASKAVGYILDKIKITDYSLKVGFHVFDDVRFSTKATDSFVKLDSYEFPSNSGRKYEMGNNAYRSDDSQAQTQPVDVLHDIRSEIFSAIKMMGVHPQYHFHGASESLCNLVIAEQSLLKCADGFHLLKYATKNIISSYGKTATFMPKPIVDAVGAAVVFELNIGEEMVPFFIGGVCKHIKAINAFSNPTQGSYKRLNTQPELFMQPKERGPIVRFIFPDPSMRPYLALASIMLAGLEGIEQKITPDYKLLHAHSIEESLAALDSDREFLYAGDVFSKVDINCYMEWQKTRLSKYRNAVCAVDFELDYNC